MEDAGKRRVESRESRETQKEARGMYLIERRYHYVAEG